MLLTRQPCKGKELIILKYARANQHAGKKKKKKKLGGKEEKKNTYKMRAAVPAHGISSWFPWIAIMELMSRNQLSMKGVGALSVEEKEEKEEKKDGPALLPKRTMAPPNLQFGSRSNATGPGHGTTWVMGWDATSRDEGAGKRHEHMLHRLTKTVEFLLFFLRHCPDQLYVVKMDGKRKKKSVDINKCVNFNFPIWH